MLTETTTDGDTTDNQRNIRQIIPQPSQTNPYSKFKNASTIKSKINLLESKQLFDKTSSNIPDSASKNNWMSESKDSKEINEFKGLKVDLSIPQSPIIDNKTNEVILISSPPKSPFSSKFQDLVEDEKESNNNKEDIKLLPRHKTAESKAEVTDEEKISKYIKLLESGN
jgi:hypothetical protein